MDLCFWPLWEGALPFLGVKTQISPWPGLCALDPCSFDCGCSCAVGVVDWSGLLPCCTARRGHHLRASQVADCLGQSRLLALMISPCHWYLVRRRLVLTAARAKKQVVGAELCCVKSTLAAFGTYLFFSSGLRAHVSRHPGVVALAASCPLCL